jgi:hypothetical protein
LQPTRLINAVVYGPLLSGVSVEFMCFPLRFRRAAEAERSASPERLSGIFAMRLKYALLIAAPTTSLNLIYHGM